MSEEKREQIERMMKKFSEIEDYNVKGFAFMCMTAYESGKEAGIQEEKNRQMAAVAE